MFYFQCLQKPNLTTDTKDKEYKPHDIPQTSTKIALEEHQNRFNTLGVEEEGKEVGKVRRGGNNNAFYCFVSKSIIN